jgi:hypothetical protein
MRSSILARLRQLTSTGTDEIFNSVTYWTDVQLEEHLNNHVSFFTQELEKGRGYFWYNTNPRYEIDNVVIEDANKLSVVGWSINFNTKRITGLDETKTYTIYADRYDMFDTAASVWDIKASHRVTFTDFKAGNHKIDLSQEYAHCLKQSLYYRGKTIRNL